MKQKEYRMLRRRIFLVQRRDAFARSLLESPVLRLILGRCVPEVREQRKVNARIAICEIVNLHDIDQVIHSIVAREHRRHDHHRAAIRRDLGREIKPW